MAITVRPRIGQQERRVLEERPRYCNALTLSARELDAAVADDGAILLDTARFRDGRHLDL